MMNKHNEKTVARTRRMAFTPRPDNAPEQSLNILPVGTHLGEFEILDLIGEGGFGIVYLAYDHSLERQVALKEYMPSGLATRTTRMAVTVRSQHNAATFTAGLKSFVNEARMLAQFDSPSLVKVYSFWEANGTAYMVMPFYEGITLKQALKQHRVTPTEQWIRLVLADLFDAIETIHHAQCLHRDIAPDNILLLKDDRPLLLDFGAARRIIGDLTQCLTAILKPGFAPIEQYADIAGLRQGPWTDIYALAAVVYYLIVGRAPPPAVARFVHDEMVPAREVGKNRYSAGFLAALDKALAVKPEQRFRSVAELRRALDITETAPRTLPRTTERWSTATVPIPTTRMADPQPAQHSPPRRPDSKAAVPPSEPPVRQQDNVRKYPRQTDVPAAGHVHVPKPTPGAPAWQIPGRPAAWTLAGIALCLAIASGIYWGTHRTSNQAPEPSVIAANKEPAPESSGSSDIPDRESADQATTNVAPAMPAAPPATTVTRPPANIASVEPRATEAAKPQSGQAQSALPAPRASQENELWRIANASDKPSAYEKYLREYPNGHYAPIARLRLERKQSRTDTAMNAPSRSSDASTKAPAQPPAAVAPTPAPSAEDELWNMAATLNQATGFETYLNKYPNGRYAPVAKDKLASLKPAEPKAPATPPVVVQPQAPKTAESKADTPEASADMQASIKPIEPSVPAEPKQSSQATPAPEPELPRASNGKSPTILKMDGQTMTGDFSIDPETGMVSGTGKIAWSNGNQFEGTLVHGVKKGKGKFVWNNGQRYSGDWARDMPNGKGTIVFANGNRYDGEVKDGMPNGQGTTHFKDGSVYSGAWVAGKSQGHGRYTWANGSYWEGEFMNDKRTEDGKMVFADDTAPDAAATASPPPIGETAQHAEPPAANTE